MDDRFQFVERPAAPALAPIFRSRQQGEILAWLLDDEDREASLRDIARSLGVPGASVHREVERAQAAGLILSRRVGNVRLVRVNRESRFVAPLRQLLIMTFGVPARLAGVLASVDGVESAYLFGSWAARYEGVTGRRPVGDIDLLVLGSPDREEVYRSVLAVEPSLGYPVHVTLRSGRWLAEGGDSFHDTIVRQPLIQIVALDHAVTKDSAPATASVAH